MAALFFFSIRNFTVHPIDARKPSAEASKPAARTTDRPACSTLSKETVMKSRLSVVALALSSLVAGHAVAADTASVGKTRAEVRAELAQAVRSGDLIANGETGQRFNEIAPHLYPQPVVVGAKSRAEVKAELAEAIRTGDLIANGEIGLRFNQISPAQYAAVRAEAPAVGKTREQVKAELAEAIRTGDIVADGETGQRLNQLYPNRYPQPVLAQGKTRDEVRAELVNSRRANGG
jgi:predicted RNase H-like HicB family nuclease